MLTATPRDRKIKLVPRAGVEPTLAAYETVLDAGLLLGTLGFPCSIKFSFFSLRHPLICLSRFSASFLLKYLS